MQVTIEIDMHDLFNEIKDDMDFLDTVKDNLELDDYLTESEADLKYLKEYEIEEMISNSKHGGVTMAEVQTLLDPLSRRSELSFVEIKTSNLSTRIDKIEHILEIMARLITSPDEQVPGGAFSMDESKESTE